MNEIVVTFDPRTDRARRIEREFNKRIAKRSIGRFAVPAALLAFVVVFFALRAVFDRAGSEPIWIFPTIAFFLAYDIVRKLAHRRALAARDAAPIRNRSSATLRLGPSGVNAEGAQLYWNEIIEVMRLDGATMLLTLPYQALPVPDEALPAGVTAEQLQSLITEWRTK